MKPTVVMVCGSSDYKKKVDDQLSKLVAHYGEVILLTFCSAGPSYQASGWAIKNGVFFAELPNHRKRYGAKAAEKAAAAALALGPTVCISFGRCTESEAAKAAGVATYEV